MTTVKDRIDPKYLVDLETEIARDNSPGDFLHVDVREQMGDIYYYDAAYNMFQSGCRLNTAASALLERARDLQRLRSREV
jgi:hypothetical protein